MEGEKVILSNSSSSSEELVHSISILLVDNDLTCLSIVAAMLKKFNYQVVTARHPQDALYTLRLKEGAFDLVISDVHMPDMDGFELQKAIKQEFNLPVVLMSADDHDGIVSKGLDTNGAAFFIPKPVSADNLRDIWQFASKNKKKQVTVEETESLPDPETSSEEFNLDEITISDSSTDEDTDVENDSNKKSPKKRMSNENGDVSASTPAKKPKLIWTNSLHNRFLEAIRKIGLDKAVPKKILEVMDVLGLTRENVASHLQKYRMFLRRVADASLELSCRSDEGSTRRFISRLTPPGSSSSTSILNNFSKNHHQNPWRSPNSNPLFRNLSASSSSVLSGSTYARILANKGNFGKPDVTSSKLMIHESTSRSSIRFGENSSNIQTKTSVENPISTTSPGNLSKHGLLSSFNATSSGENIGTSSNSSMEPSKSFAYPQTNYVGYRLSNLQHQLAESGMLQKNQGGVQSDSGVVDLPNAEMHGNNLSSEANFDDLLDQLLADSTAPPSALINNSEKQLLDIIADYEKLIVNPGPSLQNGDGMHGDTYSSLFDLDGFDVMSTKQPLDGVQLNHTTTVDPASSFHNQEQISRNPWPLPMLRQQPTNHTDKAHEDRQCDVSQELEATPRLGEIHQSLNEQQAVANTDLANSLEFKASSQLNDIYLSPTQDEDEEFLESLFVNFPGENQTLDGV